MRKILCAAALTLALCCTAFAGEIPNPPAPQPQGVTAEGPTDGNILNYAPDDLAQMALDLLATLPSLL